ncbi:pilus assembly FimT family protein [Stutzerimonas nitrititolerans]|uniref:pilus assembly FimT family protein n=1 Tax=Stutzerimonas nitrititolerans TaxID=2482751 RepID=UPI0028AB00B6|nr:type II secretion system protein [Stutzerimonas nitrititolerans]
MAEQRGFTIVELIMVIVIIGILAAGVGPRFFAKSNFDERFYFEETLSVVRYAQKLAVASGCRIKVSRDSTSGRFLLHRADNCDAAKPQYNGEVIGPDGQSYSDKPDAEESDQGPGPSAINGFPFVFSSLGCVYDSVNRRCATDTEATRVRVQVGNLFTFKVHAATGFIEVTP